MASLKNKLNKAASKARNAAKKKYHGTKKRMNTPETVKSGNRTKKTAMRSTANKLKKAAGINITKKTPKKGRPPASRGAKSGNRNGAGIKETTMALPKTNGGNGGYNRKSGDTGKAGTGTKRAWQKRDYHGKNAKKK